MLIDLPGRCRLAKADCNYGVFDCSFCMFVSNYIKLTLCTRNVGFQWKRLFFTSKFDLYVRKKPVKCYVWSRDFYGAETWT